MEKTWKYHGKIIKNHKKIMEKSQKSDGKMMEK